MAKKIKFPLKMADGSQVRNIEELREHFDLTAVLSYYTSGRLAEWLTDRYYDVEAEKIKALEPSSKEFAKNLCEILAVPYSETGADDVDLADIAVKNERYEHLKQFTADDTILAAVDLVAFTQEDLADLLDKDAKLIYLCGERFSIPCSKGGITYIGINNPVVDIPGYYNKKEILFKGVQGKNIPDDSTKNVFPSDSDSFRDSPNKTVQKPAEASKRIASEGKDGPLGPYFAEMDDFFTSFLGKAFHKNSFRLVVQTTSEIYGRGTIVEGVIEKGSVQTTDEVTITKKDGTSFQAVVLGIELFRKILDYAEEGDKVGLLLRGVSRKDVSKGDVVTKN